MNEASLKQTLFAIHNALMGKTVFKNSEITIKAMIEQDHLPYQIKTFLIAEVEFSARSFLKHLHSPRFDFSHQSLAQSRNRFAKDVLMTAKLTEQDFSKYLEEAILLNCRYLYQPQQVLSELIFGSKSEQESTEIHDRLKNFSDYSYLTDVFLQYLEKKQVASISVEKFQKIISDIDRKIIQTYGKADLLALFHHLFDFFKLGGKDEAPIDLLITFLNEKKLLDLEKELIALRDQGLESLSLKDVELILNGESKAVIENAMVAEKPAEELPEPIQDEPVAALPVEPTESVEQPLEQEQILDEAFLEPIVEYPPLPDEIKTLDDDELAAEINAAMADFKPELKNHQENKDDNKSSEPKPLPDEQEQEIFLDDSNVPFEENLPKNFENDLSFLEKAPINPEPHSSMPMPEPDPEPIELPTMVGSNELSQPAKPEEDPKIKDLRALISDSDRKRLIKKLFKGKSENFDQAISDINAKKSWREASVYIDEEIFSRYNIDEYMQEAVFFTDLVFERYQGQD